MALWGRIDHDIDAAAWSAAGEREGVLFSDARDFDFFHRDAEHMRLGFSFHDPVELDDAVRRMARALISMRAVSVTFQTNAIATLAKQGETDDSELAGNAPARWRQTHSH